jgi:Ca2+-binding EF-hand superfamily protein
MRLALPVSVCLALAIGTLPSGSAEGPRPEKHEYQDVLLLADDGPVLLRLHVQIDGKPYGTAWERYLDKLFADLDRDGDGFLSKAEAVRAPSVEFLQSFLQGNLNLEAAAETVPFKDMDVDGDGRVSPGEFASYYRRCAFDRLRVLLVPGQGNAAALTDALFHLLDLDGDGKLSKAELKGAAATLRRVDLNEDEWITPDELLLHRPVVAHAPKAKAPALETVGFLPLEPAGLSDDRSRAVLARYDRSKLDTRQLKALLSGPPQLELLVRLGKLAKDETRIEIFNPNQRPMPLARGARRTEDGALLVQAGGLALEVFPGSADSSVRGLHAFYRQQFEAADANKLGYLERKQVADLPTLAALFPLADHDADGKLTEKEFNAFLDLHALGAASFVSLTVSDQSLGLFDLLDENRDGRLSLRELHTAWERLRGFDRDGDGKLDRAEFPRQLRVRLGQGKASLRTPPASKPAGEPAKPRGPSWFRKMDRNGDGYVSRREFLGPEELFNKLDTDGDGLISPEEAERLPDVKAE